MDDKKIYLLAADMGYGHQRAAYPLLAFSKDGAINLNNYEGIAAWEKSYWLNSLKSYEKISYFKKVPLIGSLVFKVMDYFQKIEPFYPRRDLSAVTIQQKMFLRVIKKGLGKDLIESLKKNPLPFVTTFFVAAYCAEYYNYPGKIYCIACDADVSRAWAPLNPGQSKVIYLVPNQRVADRLQMYGVLLKNIKITGFPLPLENIGDNDGILKTDLRRRLHALDPIGSFREVYSDLLGDDLRVTEENAQPLTVTFAVGGAGAQREMGVLILKKLTPFLEDNKVRLNLVAGSRTDVNNYFEQAIAAAGLAKNENVRIIYHPQKMEYFRLFNICLRDSDLLWTKPSELSFYAGLGLPIIMSEPVGSQEVFNREWLLSIGAGLDGGDPRFVDEWLFDWHQDGRLARAALCAYLNANHAGVNNIEKEVFNK